MRRILTSLAVVSIMALAFAPAASAGKFVTPQKADWFYTPSGSSNDVSDVKAYGHAQIVDPMGSANFIVNGVVKLEPNTGYAVWVRELYGYTGPSITPTPGIGYYKLSWFMTDEFGYGTFQVKSYSTYLPTGSYPIQVAINQDDGTNPAFVGTTVIATQWNPGLMVTVHS